MFIAFFFLSGCYHDLHITNLSDYIPPAAPPLESRVKLGATSNNGSDPQNKRYTAAILDALDKSGNFEKMTYPFNPSSQGDQPDITIDISVTPRYSGSRGNFFINWPGYLIFAPAIWGYSYHAELETGVSVTDVKEGRTRLLTIPTAYRFRHAEMDRTWTEVGWFATTFVPLIGGFVFTTYDTDTTAEFISKVSVPYGQYVAEKIIEAIHGLHQEKQAAP